MVTKSPIVGSDFEVMGPIKHQANVLLFGDAGNGKTTFVTMHAPEPVAHITFDNRDKYAVQRAMKAKRRVYRLPVDYPANVTKLGDQQARTIGQAAVNKVLKNFELAVKDSIKGNVRTICLDTGTEYNEILTLAVTGRLDKTQGDYGRSKGIINREWWRLFNMAREGNAHFVVLARAKAIWKNNEPTGKFTFRGPEVINDAVDWAAQIRLRSQKKGKEIVNSFEMEMTKCGIDISQLGEVYNSEMWEEMGGPFVYACLLQYDGSDEEDWR